MSLRRNVRLRREYLYRKSLEGKERTIYERKKRLRECLREGKQIPTELRGEEAALREQLKFDDDGNIKPRSHVDDEYNSAGVHDPRICVTTSRDPSSRLKQFAKELRLVFPNSIKINRGSYKIKDLVHVCRENNVTDLVMRQEHRGEPDGITICHLPYGPTAYFGLSSVVMRHAIEERGTVSAAIQLKRPARHVAVEPDSRVWAALDTDGDGAVDASEFAALDLDGDRSVSRVELL